MDIAMRRARRSDAIHVAALMDIASHSMEVDHWRAQTPPGGSPMETARHLVLTDETLPYHLARASILEVDGEIAGLLVSGIAPGVDGMPAGFPAFFRPLLELEALLAGHFTVVGVALYAEFRGRGLARHILGHAEGLALAAGAPGMGIVVEDDNVPAIASYSAFGFRPHARRPWIAYGGREGPTDWVLMTRPLPAGN